MARDSHQIGCHLRQHDAFPYQGEYVPVSWVTRAGTGILLADAVNFELRGNIFVDPYTQTAGGDDAP